MDHRRPTKVTNINSFKEDSARRDFGINSLGINSKGEIIDYQGGLDDIKNNIIRAIGKPRDRFTEDALRILRLFRFAARYNFDIDADTKQAAKELGHLIDDISVERVTDELKKVSDDGKHLANYIEHLNDIDLLERILPEVNALKDKTENPKHHPEAYKLERMHTKTKFNRVKNGSAFDHTMAALRQSKSNNPITNLAILFHDLGKGTVTVGNKNGYPTYNGHDKESAKLVKDIGTRLKFSNTLTNAIEFAAANHMKVHYIYEMGKKKISNLVNDSNWPILKDVVYADEMSRSSSSINSDTIEEFNKKMKFAEDIASELSKGGGQSGIINRLKEKINGLKVMKYTGLPPGKEMGIILHLTQDWLYNNIDATDKEIKDFVLNTYNQRNNKDSINLESIYEALLMNYNE